MRSADGTRITAERLRVGAPGVAGGGVGTSTGTALAGVGLSRHGRRRGRFLARAHEPVDRRHRPRDALGDRRRRRQSSAGTVGRHDPVGASTIELAPGARRAIDAEQLGTGRFAVVVESDVPIVGERDVIIGAERFTAIAVPDAASAVAAQPSLFSDDLGG